MEELLNLLRDGHSRSIEMLAAELNTTVDDIKRRIELLEHSGIIRRVLNIKNNCSNGCSQGCNSCPGCKAHTAGKNNRDGEKTHCRSCLPEGGFKNMGEMWEVI